jgi:hypothetical protein
MVLDSVDRPTPERRPTRIRCAARNTHLGGEFVRGFPSAVIRAVQYPDTR